MGSPLLAVQLANLTAHLRPDRAKVFEAYARAIAETGSFADASVRVQKKFKTKKQRESLQVVSDLLNALSEIAASRDELSELARHLAAPPPSDEKNQKLKASSEPAAARATAAEIADKLKDARLDRERFSILHRQLGDAKQINTPTLHRIANMFLGTDQKFSGRKQALDAVLRRHHDELRIANQDRMLDRLE